MAVRTPAKNRERSTTIRGRFGSSHVALLALLACGVSHAALALPSGGSVQSGSASFARSSNSLTINQTSQNAIINWSNFSIGEGGVVRINNGSGATLDRVTGSSVSNLDGLLSATGSVYLINPNGIIIGKTGQVDVGGTFVASTLDIPDSAFGDTSKTFTGSSRAAVINLGAISALGGDVVLMASNVQNSGVITAANGDIGLLAGSSILIRDMATEDGKFVVQVGGRGQSVTNSGALQAAMVELRANQGNVYALAGNTIGVIDATGISSDDGKVFLVAEGGSLTADGVITARGVNNTPGYVETSGAAVNFTGVKIDTGGGTWLVDPDDLTVDAGAAATLDANLATTSVTLQTTASGASGPGVVNASGAGDIDVTAPITWSSGNTLTLDAYHGVNITAPVTVAGAGKVILTIDDGGTGGDLGFGLTSAGFSGSLSFTGTPHSGQGLTINGQAYTLLYSINDLGAISNAAGYYALALPIDGSGTTFTSGIVLPQTNFTGVFTGLGNTISNVTANGGIFSTVAGGSIRDLGVLNYVENGSNLGIGQGIVAAVISNTNIDDVYVTGSLAGNNGLGVGPLVGWASGTGEIINSYTNVYMTCGCGQTGGVEGGLVGFVGSSGNNGAETTVYDLNNDHAMGNIIEGGTAGGLVGSIQSGSTITNSSATGSVQGSTAGGLVGQSQAGVLISGSYATGNVTAESASGGLVGNSSATISNSFATGAVSGDNAVGGLVGMNSGSISDSFSTGAVSITVQNGVSFIAGGFVGQNVTNASAGGTPQGCCYSSTGAITNSYSLGSVTVPASASSTNPNTPLQIGGFVGYINAGSISSSYSTGYVAVQAPSAGSSIGGFAGASAVDLTGNYYDSDTSGQALGAQAYGTAGLHTSDLQGALPSGFNTPTWSTGAGLYPYLTNFYNSQPQAISGVATSGAGGAVAGALVGVYMAGSPLVGSYASTGANGYYYLLAPVGTVTTTSAISESFLPNAMMGGAHNLSLPVATALGYTDTPTLSFGNVVGLDIVAGQITQTTTQTALSGLTSSFSTAFGQVYAGLISATAADPVMITAISPGGFTVDQPLSLAVAESITTTSGGIKLLAPLSWTSPGSLTLNSTGAILENGTLISTEGGGTSVTLSQDLLTLNQSSEDAIVDWSKFSIDQNHEVQIANGSGVTLDRVTGAAASNIDGLLQATGSVYLINPNGIIINNSGQVDVGGAFIASTLNISDADFDSGLNSFTGSSGASIVDLGSISALGGDVALIANNVRNYGSISAPYGDIGLLGGSSVLIRDVATYYGKFVVRVGVPGTSVVNEGDLQAAMVELRADQGNVYALAGATASVINAAGVSSHDGKVFLVSERGYTAAEGSITATRSDGAPGDVITSGVAVGINGANITAGNWTIQQDNFVLLPVAAAALNANLATTSVTIDTVGAGYGIPSGDINLAASLSWTSSNSLTLSAHRNILFQPGVTLSNLGGGAITLNAPN